MKQSKLFGVNVPDFVKAAFLAGLTIIVSLLYNDLQPPSPHLPTWPEFLDALKLAGSTAGIYILKNFLSNSDGRPLKSDKK